jgi:Arc/MetJ family transcription regulator
MSRLNPPIGLALGVSAGHDRRAAICRRAIQPADGRTLLAQNAVQPELGRAHHVGHVPPDQTAATDLATKAVPSLSGVTSSRSAVNHLLKSVVRESFPHILTLRVLNGADASGTPVSEVAAK